MSQEERGDQGCDDGADRVDPRTCATCGRPRPCRAHGHEADGCHGGSHHGSHCCSCGGAHPCGGGGSGGCPRPHGDPAPGTVDVPQDTPPYQPGHADTPVWQDGRPEPGSAGEVPWFRGAVGRIGRRGPTFGPRRDEFLPYLLVRAASSDRGARPYQDVFWESPDLFVVPDQPAESASLRPATTGGTAHASSPNTLYAHVWNLGKAPAFRVRVEFWWFDPSLGFARASGHLVGAAYVDLADRFTSYPAWQPESSSSGEWLGHGCHAIVKCPATWVPTYLNGGHECLVVRVGDTVFDPVASESFSPATDRHVGQRNIAVVPAASPAEVDLDLDLGWHPRPGEATVSVTVEPPGTMEWLSLYAGSRGRPYRAPAADVTAGVLAPAPAGVQPRPVGGLAPEVRPTMLRAEETFHRGCDPLRIGAHAGIQEIADGEAAVVRVRQRIDGVLAGGYSVVLVGRRP